MIGKSFGRSDLLWIVVLDDGKALIEQKALVVLQSIQELDGKPLAHPCPRPEIEERYGRLARAHGVDELGVVVEYAPDLSP
jgi:hypothetical protein